MLALPLTLHLAITARLARLDLASKTVVKRVLESARILSGPASLSG